MQEQDNQRSSPYFHTDVSAPPQTTAGAIALPPRSSGMALTSMILGILALVVVLPSICLPPLAVLSFVLAIVGLVLGILALRAIARSNGESVGRGLAMTGIITSAIAEGVSLLLIVFIVTMAGSLVTAMRDMTTVASGRTLFSAFEQYSMDNVGSFPSVHTWRSDIEVPASISEQQLKSWVMNEHLQGMRFREIPDPAKTVLAFEVNINGYTAADASLAEMSWSPHYRYVVVFVNGQTREVSVDEVNELLWDPTASP